MSETYPAERIEHLRRTLIAHSCLYYVLDMSVITDAVFDHLAYTLVRLQGEFPEVSASVEYEREAFATFDGSTGFDLPIRTDEAIAQARAAYAEHAKPSEGEL